MNDVFPWTQIRILTDRIAPGNIPYNRKNHLHTAGNQPVYRKSNHRSIIIVKLTSYSEMKENLKNRKTNE